MPERRHTTSWAVVVFAPVGVQCTSVLMVASVSTAVSGCGMSVSSCGCVGVASGYGVSAVPCVLVETVRGVWVVFSREGLEPRFLFLSASKSVWIAYLYSLTGQWGSEVVSISLDNLVIDSL